MSDQQDPKYQAGDPPTPANLPQDVIVSPDTRRNQRIPPGQSRTKKWPVLHYGHVPFIDRDKWRLEITGLVERPLRFSWDEYRQLPRVKVFSDFHCVTRWSRLGNLWEGVSTRHLMELAGVHPEATHVIAQGYDSGWTTNLPLDEFLAEDALLVDLHDGQPLDADHGGPVRLVVPQLYAWKSAKWLKKIELVDQNQPGYWEQLGYHDHGDPWTEERFRDELGRRPDPD
ncbi:MAG: sulfite oxidase-like oxidoreductase [Maioricimonas sp. JB049]